LCIDFALTWLAAAGTAGLALAGAKVWEDAELETAGAAGLVAAGDEAWANTASETRRPAVNTRKILFMRNPLGWRATSSRLQDKTNSMMITLTVSVRQK
jgi:hypothetical protein